MVKLYEVLMDIILNGMLKFFKNTEERMLWVRLNAERIQYSQKKLKRLDEPLGKIGETHSHMQMSLNQLEYDEANRDKPRLSFEELVLSHEELFKLCEDRARQEIRTKFYKFLTGNDK